MSTADIRVLSLQYNLRRKNSYHFWIHVLEGVLPDIKQQSTIKKHLQEYI